MKKFFVRSAVGLLVLVLLLELSQIAGEQTRFTSSIAHIFFNDNFHPVVEGKIYRSSEMSGENLREIIRKHGIKTVVDLRLGKEGWIDEDGEAQVAKSEGAEYHHLSFRGSRLPKKEQIENLLALYDSAPQPLLVHCSSGTHRSGVAAAIWLLDKEGQSPEEAGKQLAPKYGFFRFEREIKSAVQGHPTIDNLIWRYEDYARKTGESFRTWVSKL